MTLLVSQTRMELSGEEAIKEAKKEFQLEKTTYPVGTV